VVAAYRDRYGVTDATRALGAEAVSDRQRADARALAAEVLSVDASAAAVAVQRAPQVATSPRPVLERPSPVGR
jgi:hypothetical protein